MTDPAPRRTLARLSQRVLCVDDILGVLALVALMFVPVLGMPAALLFLASGGLLIGWKLSASIQQFIGFWYLFLLPVFCAVTVLWSQYPGLSLRFGVQFCATAAISIAIATRISPRVFCRVLFWSLAVSMLASILIGDVRQDTGAWLGIYGSKNGLAGAAAIFMVVSVGIILDRSASNWLRVLALLAVGLGLVPLMKAQSVSALLILLPTIVLQVSMLAAPRLSRMQKTVLLSFLVLVSALAALLVLANLDPLLAQFLETTGKDLTLTGRTDLWKVATSLIAERPLFGVGYQAFWVKGHPPAEALWFMFGIDGRSGFNFHNTYLSNAVEVGVLGVVLQIFVLFGAAVATGIWALRTHDADGTVLFALVMMVIMISFVEVPVFFQFSPRTVMVFCAFVFGVRALRGNRFKTP